MLHIQEEFLSVKNYKFLLTSRFSQDCLENFFYMIRSKQVIPNASQFKNNLKSVCVSQFLKDVSKSNYDEDDRRFLVDFLDYNPDATSPPQNYKKIELPQNIEYDHPYKDKD